MAIKVNIITGFLGVGKTSAVRNLLQQKPENEYWAVVVNEFGEVGIDESLLETEEKGNAIRQIPGGCVCCTVGLELQATLKELVKEVKPDRIIIEPSGIGHPAGIIDTIEGTLKGEGEVQAVITLIDPRNLNSEKHMGHETFNDQIELADVLVANKVDLCSEDVKEQFFTWAKELFPPKQDLIVSEYGKIPYDLLNEKRTVVREVKHHTHDHHHHHHAIEREEPTREKPVFYESIGFGVKALGVIFSNEVLFDADRLHYYLEAIQGTDRIKGVFRTNHRWLTYNKTGQDMAALFPSAYRKDSRLEIILPEDSAFTLDVFEKGMRRLLEDCGVS